MHLIYGDLICGDKDDPNLFRDSKSININEVNNQHTIVVFDILGRKLFEGTYSSFAAKASKYPVTDGQVLILVNQKIRKSQ